jgi:hypothetical protein
MATGEHFIGPTDGGWYMRMEALLHSAVGAECPARNAWPFYYDCEQQALLSQIRAAWGEDCVIQIVGGRLRIFADDGRLELLSNSELSVAIAARLRGRMNPRRQQTSAARPPVVRI